MCIHLLTPTSFCFILFIKSTEVISPYISKSRSLIGTEESPLLILFNTFHKEIGNPQSKEEIAGAFFLGTCVELELEEIFYIRMPRFQIDSKGAISLATALIYIASCVVKHTKHRNQTITVPICSLNKRAAGTNVVDMKTNPTCIFANGSTITKCLVNSSNAIIVHCKQETRRELLARSSCIEECGSGVHNELLGKEVIGFKRLLEIGSPKCKRYTHPHVLRALDNLHGCILEEIGLFQSFESEIVKEIVTRSINLGIDNFRMLTNSHNKLFIEKTALFTCCRHHLVREDFHDFREGGTRIFMMIADGNSRGEGCVI